MADYVVRIITVSEDRKQYRYMKLTSRDGVALGQKRDAFIFHNLQNAQACARLLSINKKNTFGEAIEV